MTAGPRPGGQCSDGGSGSNHDSTTEDGVAAMMVCRFEAMQGGKCASGGRVYGQGDITPATLCAALELATARRWLAGV